MKRRDEGTEELPIMNFDDDTGDVIPFRYSITSYGTDFPVDSIVERIKREDIFIPDFQRGYVWTLPEASRFIESLLLGLPVPGVFLSKEEESNRHLVIDGQQRLRTLEMFYLGRFEPKDKTFALVNVQPDFEGKTYATLGAEDRRALDDAVLHATIIRQDNPTKDRSSVYHVFERLNTGGTTLQPQEIRAAVYYGPFNTLLRELITLKSWGVVYGKPSKRMRDAELVLRFLALHFEGDRYSKPMKSFLNAFMARHRDPGDSELGRMRDVFVETIGVVAEVLGKRAFRPQTQLNAAVYEAVMVGLARRLSSGPLIDHAGFEAAYSRLLEKPDFKEATETGTSSEVNVDARLTLATQAFASLS